MSNTSDDHLAVVTPPRRWGRRIGLALLILVTLLVIAHAIWGYRAKRQLADGIAALRAAGEPVAPSDLRGPAIPDDRNAVLVLLDAASHLQPTAASWKAMDELEWTVGSRFPIPDDEQAVLRRVCDDNAQAFAPIARATKLDGIAWEIDYSAGAVSADLWDAKEPRLLASLLQAAAVLEHERGNDAKALDHIRQILFIADVAGRRPTLIGYLISNGISAMAAGTLAEMSPSVKISEADVATAKPRQVQALITLLLDDDRRQESMRRGFRGERVSQQATMQSIKDGVISPVPSRPQSHQKILGYALQPVMNEDALIMLNQMNSMIAAADAPDFATFQQRTRGWRKETDETAWWRHPYVRILMPSIDRSAQVRYRVETDCHLAAAALAIRWYAVDHEGKLPAKLEDLVPKYLPSVPLDAIAGNGKTIGYVNDPDRPRVYHVGENGTDDGGTPADPNASARDNRAKSDQVVFLKHQPRPTTRTSIDD